MNNYLHYLNDNYFKEIDYIYIESKTNTTQNEKNYIRKIRSSSSEEVSPGN